MSHPCWSFPHLLTSSPPQHAANSGPRDVLQDNTVHRQPLPQEPLQPLPEQLPHEPLPANAIRSENNAEESLSDPEYESAGNLRINTPTGYDPKEFTTEEIAIIPMMSPEEDVYQLYDVQRQIGERDQQATVMEETRGFGQIQVQSLLDQEMATMSPIEKMSYLQSRMHFDESMESNADSDLEDGEIRKLLTSSLCAQGASGSPDAMDTQESEVNAQTSHSSEGREATGRPVALFSPKRNEQRNQTWSSVFGNADVSNLSETLLEGNKDHLLNRARTDLARREIHVESPNKCIDDLQK